MQPLERIEHGDFIIEIHQDDEPLNPRKDWDQLGIMVCWHRDNLGDREMTSEEETAATMGTHGHTVVWPALEKHLLRNGAVGPILPLGLLDHSGLHIYVGGGPHWTDSAGWDSGTVGFIYTTREKLDLMGTPEDRIEEVLRAEVEEYGQYLRGDVYGYIVRPRDKKLLGGTGIIGYTSKGPVYGDPLDESCWGFFGYDYCVSEAKAVADGLAPQLEQAIQERNALFAGGEVLE